MQLFWYNLRQNDGRGRSTLYAAYWLSFVSFIEAIFFPIPPDVMLIPMSMAKPQMHLIRGLHHRSLRAWSELLATLLDFMRSSGCNR